VNRITYLGWFWQNQQFLDFVARNCHLQYNKTQLILGDTAKTDVEQCNINPRDWWM